MRDLLLLVGDLDGADGDLLLRLYSRLLIDGASEGVGREPVGEVGSMASMSYRGLAAKTFLGYVLHAKALRMLEDASSLGPGL